MYEVLCSLTRVLFSLALPSGAAGANACACMLSDRLHLSGAAFLHCAGDGDVLVSLDKAKAIANAIPESKVSLSCLHVVYLVRSSIDVCSRLRVGPHLHNFAFSGLTGLLRRSFAPLKTTAA